MSRPAIAKIKPPALPRLDARQWAGVAVVAAAILGYFAWLYTLEQRSADHFARMRAEDPAVYLEQLREADGFARFLPEYATLTGLDAFKADTPSFLLGRWTMQKAPLRLPPGVVPEQCSDPITFDYGLVLMAEAGGSALSVQYRVADGGVDLKGPTVKDTRIALVSFGALLDHLEFTPPGRETGVYAYRCGH